MNNVFNTPLKIDYRYDLKGSTLGRKTDVPIGQRDNTIALKDLDFLEEKKPFKVGRDNKNELIKIIRKDAEFFSNIGIIDYSLLVGVHDKSMHAPVQTDINQILASEATLSN